MHFPTILSLPISILVTLVTLTTSSFSLTFPLPTMTPSPPITRIAAFKFHPTTSPAQISDRARTFLALYAEHPELILVQPRGGKSLRVGLDFEGTGVTGQMEWDVCFVLVFKDDDSRKEFDADPGHERIKKETDPLLEKVFVYDFKEEDNLGW